MQFQFKPGDRVRAYQPHEKRSSWHGRAGEVDALPGVVGDYYSVKIEGYGPAPFRDYSFMANPEIPLIVHDMRFVDEVEIVRGDGRTRTEPRLEIDQVLDVCNRVRKAGGAEPLAALMPGVPELERECLIAVNLNFDSMVMPSTAAGDATTRTTIWSYPDGEKAWFMVLGAPERAQPQHRESVKLAQEIGKALDWPLVGIPWLHAAPTGGPPYFYAETNVLMAALLLPREFGRVAAAFDGQDIEYNTLIAEVDEAGSY